MLWTTVSEEVSSSRTNWLAQEETRSRRAPELVGDRLGFEFGAFGRTAYRSRAVGIRGFRRGGGDGRGWRGALTTEIPVP